MSDADPQTPDRTSKTDLAPGTRLRSGGQPPPRPRWVNWFGIALAVVVVLFFVLHFAGLAPMSVHR